jgi:uncharacterized protein involved in exopolysaccharide biosynthesis
VSAGNDPRAFASRAALPEEESGGGLPAFLLDPEGAVRRRWRWMAGALAVGLVATAVATLTWPLQYIAQATILISSQEIPEEFVRSTVREDSIANINALAGKVFSQANLMRVIEEQQLYRELEGKVRPHDLAARMLRSISFERVDEYSSGRGKRPESSTIYGVSFTSDSGLRSAEVANALAALFVEASIARRNDQARRTTEFLRKELERDEQQLREITSRIAEFRQQHRGELPSELDGSTRKLDMLAQQRQALTTEISTREGRIASLISLPSEAEASPNEVLLDELRRQLARESAINTEEHPNVIAIRHRIARQEELVRRERTVGREPSANVKRLIDAERAQLETLRTQIAQIDADIAAVSERVDRTPKVGEELSALEERATVLRENYLGSLRKVEEAQLAESLESAQQGSQVSLLDAARPPRSPEIPRAMVLLGGLAGSLALAILVALVLELADPVLVSPRQVEDIASLPVLGSLPRIS